MQPCRLRTTPKGEHQTHRNNAQQLTLNYAHCVASCKEEFIVASADGALAPDSSRVMSSYDVRVGRQVRAGVETPLVQSALQRSLLELSHAQLWMRDGAKTPAGHVPKHGVDLASATPTAYID